jgi:hypothetical protein
MTPELDRLFLQGKLTEDEYCALAMQDEQVVAVAVCDYDRLTTVSLSLTKSGYLAEVLYSPDSANSDEKFLKKEASFSRAKEAFLSKIKHLQVGNHHSFDVTWFLKKPS